MNLQFLQIATINGQEYALFFEQSSRTVYRAPVRDLAPVSLNPSTTSSASFVMPVGVMPTSTPSNFSMIPDAFKEMPKAAEMPPPVFTPPAGLAEVMRPDNEMRREVV